MKKIILRLDLNVPIDNSKNKILDTERIDVVLPEIKNLTSKNFVTILSHLGKGEKTDSLGPVEDYIRKNLSKAENANLVLHANTRWTKGETSKESSKEFKEASKYFASFGTEYIDDAFSAMHRAHASITGVPKIFKKENKKVKIGQHAKIEIKKLEKSLKLAKDKKKKTLLILSGAKISTKLPLIEKYLGMQTKIFVAGGIANQILKDILNKEIGASLYEKDFILKPKIKKNILKAIKNKNILLPIDAILSSQKIEDINNIKKGDIVADIGPATLALLEAEIKSTDNIIINGPLGKYEQGFTLGTEAVLKKLKNIKNKNILIGGGDTLVLTKKLKMKNSDNLYISTAGGAMLEFLTNDGVLPGIKAIKQ